MTSNSQVIGLEVILPSLTSNMGQAMGALYEIQMVTIKAGSQNVPGLSNQFKEIREALYQYWNSISQVLKKGNSFASEVARLQGLFQASNRVEMGLLLQELIIKCETCQKESHKLVEQHKVTMQQYIPAKANFTTTLRTLTNSNGEKRRRSGSQPPIDEGAIGRFGKAFEDLWKDVENMDIFFNVQLTKCKRFLDAAQGRNKDVSMDESRQFADQWSGYHPMLLKTYVDVCGICDAVTVSPDITTVLAASTPNTEHRSGSWLDDLLQIVASLLGLPVAATA